MYVGGSDNRLPNWYLFTWEEDIGTCLYGRRHSATCGCDEGVGCVACSTSNTYECEGGHYGGRGSEM